ncbi:hypothetical protein Pmar_PMAR013752 [Perkinsus marinus ATCC 50983]|uniref:Uncharacterized protein n=1 Tax=Perkinsus marinus (strain ATCC 50983 / TXsc) TaxID=423536 RepID=C5LY73_PERM5|nr:hypothetical protein Pmar_PMAR013752 [Perkinsus marinus ATCC 50983]EEQ98403.1 hypothetical protein Pmar_PMAR013752 [Perkinsus marinus ATCC 50983]|eukprot:XP_002765686.1 hypothetical protein Pmar_PMAR013752 [Perkinsus marinus ATCC 50983]
MVFQNEFTKHLETDEVWGMASVWTLRLYRNAREMGQLARLGDLETLQRCL